MFFDFDSIILWFDYCSVLVFFDPTTLWPCYSLTLILFDSIILLLYSDCQEADRYSSLRKRTPVKRWWGKKHHLSLSAICMQLCMRKLTQTMCAQWATWCAYVLAVFRHQNLYRAASCFSALAVLISHQKHSLVAHQSSTDQIVAPLFWASVVDCRW